MELNPLNYGPPSEYTPPDEKKDKKPDEKNINKHVKVINTEEDAQGKEGKTEITKIAQDALNANIEALKVAFKKDLEAFNYPTDPKMEFPRRDETSSSDSEEEIRVDDDYTLPSDIPPSDEINGPHRDPNGPG